MDGITVLYEFALREEWAIFLICIGSSLGIASLIVTFCFRDDTYISVPSAVCVLLCLLLVGFCLEYDGRVYFQKVLINDSVNLVEFSKHYKITNQEGKIYTVKLIEQKEVEQKEVEQDE